MNVEWNLICQFCSSYLVLSISSKIVIFHWRHRSDSIRVGAAGLNFLPILRQQRLDDGEFLIVCVFMFVFGVMKLCIWLNFSWNKKKAKHQNQTDGDWGKQNHWIFVNRVDENISTNMNITSSMDNKASMREK